MALIYAVEDDKNILEIEMFALKNSGYQVEGFECARDFYKKLEEKQPDLALLDIMLPDEDGQQTLIHPGNRREGHRGYLVTTTGRVNGAVAFFYPGVKDILAEKMGGDYYVAFPSVHEAIIHPVHCINVREIRTSVQRINAVYGDGEMLSDRIFCYHKNRRLLQLL